MTTLHIEVPDDEPDTMHITIDPPILYKGGEIRFMQLCEPKARQVREAEKEYTIDRPEAGRVAYETKLILLVAGLPSAAGDALPISLINHAAAFLHGFIEAGGDDTPDDDDDDAVPQAETLSIEPAISFAGVTYSEMDLREPLGSELRKARQLMSTPGSLFEGRRAQMHLVSLVTGWPAPAIEQLTIRQLNRASRSLSRFITAGRKTGRR